MLEAGLRRGYLVAAADGSLSASHELLSPLARALAADRRDYRGHRAVFLEIGSESDHLLGAFVHRTRRGQAAGGVRFWRYDTVEQLLRDGLRLARGMGHKNALAGLWWGGGKGVIARRAEADHLDPSLRAAVYRDYGRFISGLRGCYVTAEDAGTTSEDMAWIHTTTRHTTCIPVQVGGSGNPSELTARGVIAGMEAALAWLDRGSLEGKVVVSQGVGNVARFMIGGLLERGVRRVLGADIDERALDAARALHADERVELRRSQPEDVALFAERCDVFSPNALGAVLGPRTIPLIQAAVVCGGANNQLEDPERDAAALAHHGVLYVPDFLTNRMGIVNCANEQYGRLEDDPAIHSHLERDTPSGIFQRATAVFRRARESGRTPAEEAQRLADELSDELHPIWGDRGQLIIDDLVLRGWERQPPIAAEPVGP